jgi:hypothetical protein
MSEDPISEVMVEKSLFKNVPKDLYQISLAKNCTVEEFIEHYCNQNKNALVSFLRDRFMERFIIPMDMEMNDFKNDLESNFLLSEYRSQKHGFSTMAICCLMIETLQSFRKGLPDTRGQTRNVFLDFFRENRNFQLNNDCLRESFYEGVRCGILHQAETTGGWKICRAGELISVEEKTINATEFLREMRKVLENYCKDLKRSEWDEKNGLWHNFLQKMETIIKNCESK